MCLESKSGDRRKEIAGQQVRYLSKSCSRIYEDIRIYSYIYTAACEYREREEEASSIPCSKYI